MSNATETRKIARLLADNRRRMQALERSAQAGYMSVENGSFDVHNADGTTVTQIGVQPDGSVGAVVTDPTEPSVPSIPTVTPAVYAIAVAWDGMYVTDQTTTVAYVGVHTTQDVANPSWTPHESSEMTQITPGGGSVLLPADPGVPTKVVLVAVSAGGVWSIPSVAVTVTPLYSAATESGVDVDDGIPPEQPSALAAVSSLGTVRLTWDGFDHLGNPMSPDFSHLEVQISDSPDFPEENTELVWSLYGAGTAIAANFAGAFLPYNTDFYFRAVAFDHFDHPSTPSETTVANVVPLVDTDLIDLIVDGAHIVDGTIVASDKIVANSITATEMAANSIEAGAIAANSITADHITAGAILSAAIAADQISAVQLTSNAIDGYEIHGAKIFSGVYSSADDAGADYGAQRVEMGDVGSGDPADEIRWINNGGTPISLRHLSGYSGTALFSLYSHDNESTVLACIANSAVSDGNSWLLIGRGNPTSGGPKLKFVSTTIQARNSADSGYAGLQASEFTVSSYEKFKTDIEPAEVDTAAVLEGARLKKWKWTPDFAGVTALKAAPIDDFLDVDKEGTKTKTGKVVRTAAFKAAASAAKNAQVAQAEALAAEDQYGLVADDLPEYLLGEDGISLSALAGFLWQALKDSNARIAVLEARETP